MCRITKEKVFEVIKTSRQHCVTKDNISCEVYKKFEIPIYQSLVKIFCDETKLNLYKGKPGKCYLTISTSEQLTIIEKWIEERKELVFLRDLLDMSLALSFNYNFKVNKQTKLGELEHKAKNNQDKQAISTMINIVTEKITNLPFYKDADIICAVPANSDKSFDLPKTIVKEVSEKLGKEDVTKYFNVSNKKSLKNVQLEKKWPILEQAKIIYKYNISGKTVILFDDKYQSGITMHYMAMKLYQAGAKKVYGLCFIKTMRNTDNINRENDVFFS